MNLFLQLDVDCKVCSLRAANNLGVHLESGIHHLIRCVLSAQQCVRSSSGVEDTFRGETDGVPGFRELSGY